MRWPILLVLSGLALLSSSVYAPLLGSAVFVADPAFVLLAWICLVDRWPRILLVSVAIFCFRIGNTIASPLEVLGPLISIVLVVRLVRSSISPHDRWRRMFIIIPALLLAGFTCRQSMASDLEWGFSGFFADGALAFIVAAIMFPLLDLTRPLLKSARYPE